MKTYPANVLAEQYELEPATKESFFEYIIDSNVNGQNSQMTKLFNQMDLNDKSMFIDYLRFGSEWLSDDVKVDILSTLLISKL